MAAVATTMGNRGNSTGTPNPIRDSTEASFSAQSGGSMKPSAQLPGTPKVDFNAVLDDKLPF